MALARPAIDTSDGATTDAIYAWARRSGHGQVIAVKGVAAFDRSTPVDGPTFVDVTKAGRKIRRGVRLWKVAGAVFKSETYRFLRLAAPTDEELAAEWHYRGMCEPADRRAADDDPHPPSLVAARSRRPRSTDASKPTPTRRR